MEIRITILFTVFMIIGSISLWLAPMISRRSIFFGVTVSPEFLSTDDAKVILRHYRKLTAAVTVVAMAGLWATVPYLKGPLWIVAFAATWLMQFGASVAAFASAHHRVLAFSRSHNRTRTALLEPRKRTLPGGWIPLVAPLVLVAVAGLFLYARRHSMAAETFRGSFSSLLVAVFVDVLTIVISYLAVHRTRLLYTADPSSRKDRRFNLGYFSLLFFAYYLTLFQIGMAFITSRPIESVPGTGVFVLMIAFTVTITIVALGFQFSATYKLRHAPDSADAVLGDSTPDECWRWGIIYYNRDDPAFLVEKRVGFGWTLNYGNKWSWVLSVGLLAAPFVIRFFWFM
jgi:uncharacterized membrane protein